MDKLEFESFVELKISDITALVMERKAFDFETSRLKIMHPISTIMEKVIVDIYYTGNNYCAHAPILLGCVSTGATLSDIKKNIKEAIEFHVESSIIAYNWDKPTTIVALCLWLEKTTSHTT